MAPADEAFVRNVMEPAVMRFEGNALPVSSFSDNLGGVMKPGTRPCGCLRDVREVHITYV